jgi:transmembrane sensor
MKLPQGVEECLTDYFSGNLTEEGNLRLEEWLNSSEENRKWFNAISDQKNINDLSELYELRSSKHWARMQARIQQSKRRLVIKRLSKIAAIIALPIMLAVGLYYIANPTKENIAANEVIQPGGRKAILEFSNGERVDLGQNTSQVFEKDGAKLLVGKNLVYQSKTAKTVNVFYDVINVPIGGEYSLQLSDGTRVWLNANSKLKFPAIFPEGKREVWLEGEAYFEVEHNPESSFVVKTKYMDATVLGTSFNLSAYDDDEESHLTLVSGRVLVKTDDENPKLLEPEDRYTLNHLTKETKISKVETEVYTSWKDGVFFFNLEKLETIMQKASRWYNVKIVFESDAAKNMVFFGKLKRYETINKLLDMIKLTNKIDYSISENIVRIRKI